MMTKIEWCDITLNPVVGCSKCSPGCLNCYAEKFAARLAKNPATQGKYAGVVDENGWTGQFSQPSLAEFKKLPKSPRRVFIGSMTDIFHDGIVKGGEYHKTWLPMLFDAMFNYPQHTFLLLTKRPENMKAWIDFTLETCVDKPLPNVWLGVTVCNQQEADEKLPILMKIPAAKRFVSVEPMFGPVNLEAVRFTFSLGFFGDVLRWYHLPYGSKSEDYPALDWVICGAETGPRARPMDLQWARDLRDQCQAARVPFFFKKAGNKKPIPDDLMVREFPEG